MTTQQAQVVHSTDGRSLADILERILDKGIVVAGDVVISIADIELLKIKLRLVICSVDKAKEIGIDWWNYDPNFSSKASVIEAENKELKEKLARLEEMVEKNGK
jgi:hypothetical protein